MSVEDPPTDARGSRGPARSEASAAPPADAWSQLLRLIERPEVAGPADWLVALHADGDDLEALLPLARAVAGGRLAICALQAPRALNALTASGHDGNGRWAGYRGYSWYRRDHADQAEPASLGDALWQIELVLRELRAEGARAVWLLGHREGATLALAAAAVLPSSLVDGVVALGGARPALAGAGPLTPAAGVPILDLTGSDVPDLADVPASFAAAIRRWLELPRPRSPHTEEALP